jgi:hypothetical protein
MFLKTFSYPKQNTSNPKKRQNIRPKWKKKDLEKSLQSISSGLPVATALRQCVIPRIILRNWLLRKDKTPERKLGRHIVLNLAVEEELKGRIVHQ